MNSMRYYLILPVMTIIGAYASFFLKKASSADRIQKLLLTPSLYAGGFLYLLSALLNIYILRYMDYSVVLPLTSITYIWTFFMSYFFLNEHITRKNNGYCVHCIGRSVYYTWLILEIGDILHILYTLNSQYLDNYGATVMLWPVESCFFGFVCAPVVSLTREALLPENFYQGHLRALVARSEDTQNNHMALDRFPSLAQQCCI